MDDRELLLTYLADRDVACPECYYNLRDNKEGRCPECGGLLGFKSDIIRIAKKPLRRPIKPGDGMHKFAVTGLTIPTIFFCLGVVMYLGETSDRMDASGEYSAYPSDSMMAMFIFGFVIHLAAALTLSNLKPWYQRRTRVLRRAVLLLSWYWLPMLIVYVIALVV